MYHTGNRLLSWAQVHTSEMPETFRMGKCLCVALAQATVGIISMILLLVLASPERANW